jgi:diaminopimelate epimerase
MEYFNADGSSGGMCGNGGRCAAAYVMAGTGKQEASFYALDYLYRAEKISDHLISLSMKDPRDIRLNRSLELNGRTLRYHYADTGAPHVVLYADELGTEGLEGIDILALGHSVRHHGAFSPGGTNVNVIATSGRDSIAMRTYERGVEAETLACGTGSVASAVITSILKGWQSPLTVLTRSGESLSVHFEGSGDARKGVRLEGPTVTVFEGRYFCAHEN